MGLVTGLREASACVPPIPGFLLCLHSNPEAGPAGFQMGSKGPGRVSGRNLGQRTENNSEQAHRLLVGPQEHGS